MPSVAVPIFLATVTIVLSVPYSQGFACYLLFAADTTLSGVYEESPATQDIRTASHHPILLRYKTANEHLGITSPFLGEGTLQRMNKPEKNDSLDNFA